MCLAPKSITHSCTGHDLSQPNASEILNSALFHLSATLLSTNAGANGGNKADHLYKAKTENTVMWLAFKSRQFCKGKVTTSTMLHIFYN